MKVDPTIVAAIILAIPASAAAIVGFMNRSRIQKLHILVNSRLTELLKTTGDAREAKGRREGVESKTEDK